MPRTTPVARLFTIMKQKKVHLALVVSEYGKLLGLVTMDDLLALLFGEIHGVSWGGRAAVQKRTSTLPRCWPRARWAKALGVASKRNSQSMTGCRAFR